MADIREDARALLAVEIRFNDIANSMMVASPYQFYLDQYRELRKDPLNETNEELATVFSIVQRTTKTNNGVSPTIESWEEFKVSALIESYPEIGALLLVSLGQTLLSVSMKRCMAPAINLPQDLLTSSATRPLEDQKAQMSKRVKQMR